MKLTVYCFHVSHAAKLLECRVDALEKFWLLLSHLKSNLYNPDCLFQHGVLAAQLTQDFVPNLVFRRKIYYC